ncbi:MAG TPA: sulfite exporter TauE/SafE family protein, partial [Candidatus Eisenbacteria bacterium]|nr:sulfite exporter TauE/SafE family protein [Candidatus Eisenbacteria bacterium]
MIEVAIAVLGASLLGSPHCVGMCGGFLVFVTGDATGARRWLAQAAYHLGRLVSYGTLGLIAGRLGQGVEQAGATVGIGRAAPIVAGVLMVVWGGTNLLRATGALRGAPATPSPLHRLLSPFVRAMRDWNPFARALAIGLVTTVIPCGFLYGFVTVAGGTGSPIAGLLVMVVFWAGTLPILASLGVLADRAVGALRARLPILSASLLIV